MRTLFALPVALFIAGGTLQAQTTPTSVTIHVVANDAKLLHDGVGGARITLTDAATGRVLAEGVQGGSSGDTRRIMLEPRKRGEAVFDTPGAARFTASLALERPTLVTITAEGPVDGPAPVRRASSTLWLVPGHDITGDGVVLVIDGLLLKVQAPSGTVAAGTIPVQTTVQMACGCPIEPGGIWDANRIRVTARLLQDGRPVAEVPLTYAGTQNHFQGEFTGIGAGRYQLEVVSVEAGTPNAGVVREELIVGGKGGM
ncbi:MAG: hypothetical protein AB7Q69_04375 [Gemmatimonadales bacterium]